MTFETAMTVDQSHPTLTKRLVCKGALLAILASLPIAAQAQLGPTTLRSLEAQAGIPDGSTPTLQAAPAPATEATATATPALATPGAQTTNAAAAPPPAQAQAAPPPPTPLKPEPIDWANFKAPQSEEERRLEAAKAKKVADMRALLGANPKPVKAPTTQKSAKDTEASPYDAQLAAIRDALIEKALQGPTRVVSTAWIDDQGRLHEDAQMTNDMRVRGVRVLNYTANGKAAIKADVDMQGPNQPICAAPDAAKWTQHVRVMARISPDVRPEDLHFANEILAGWLTEWARASQTYARRWQQSPMNIAERDAYEQALMGRTAGGRPDQGQWRLLMSIARADEGPETAAAPEPAPATILSLFRTAPDAGISRHWQLTLRLEPMFSNATPLVQQAKLTWTLPEATLIPPKLPESVAVGLAWESEKWIKAINERMACEPLQFAMKEKMGGEVHINGGRFNGLEVGDRHVMVDSRALPARMLHAGVAARLALGEVAQVDETEAVLRQVAGPQLPEKPQGDWVAMPY